jgi:hypothetical protein
MNNSILNSLSNETTVPITVFKDLDSKKPSYGHFKLSQLKDLMSTSMYTDDKGSVPLFNGTMFKSNNRQLKNAIQTSLLIFDLDGKTYNYQPNDIKTIFGKHKFYAYETHSSAPVFKEYRWRVVVPLKQPIRTDEYNSLWDNLVDKYKLDCDHATKAINAIFYLPEHSTDLEPLFLTNDKRLLNPYRFINQNLNIDSKALCNIAKRASINIETKDKLGSFNTDIRFGERVCGFDLPSIDKDKKKFSLEEIKSLANNTAVGLSLAKLIGIDVNSCSIQKGVKLTSKALHSVLPWHDKDNKASTGIMVMERGNYPGKVVFKSFKQEDAHRSLIDLHYIYACQQVGKRIPDELWTKSASLVWMARALIDAGVIEHKSFNISTKGKDLKQGTISLLKSLERLSEARSVFEYYDEDAVPFSYAFASIWSGITRQTASIHFNILLSKRIITQVAVKTAKQNINGFVFNERTKIKTILRVGTVLNNNETQISPFSPDINIFNDIGTGDMNNRLKPYMRQRNNNAKRDVLCVDTR